MPEAPFKQLLDMPAQDRALEAIRRTSATPATREVAVEQPPLYHYTVELDTDTGPHEVSFAFPEEMSEADLGAMARRQIQIDRAATAESELGTWDQFIRQVNKGVVPLLDSAHFALQAGVVGISPAATQEQVAEIVGLGRAPEGEEGRKVLGFQTPFTRKGTPGEFFEGVTAPDYVLPQGYAGAAGEIIGETLPAAMAFYGATAKVAANVSTGVTRAIAPGPFKPTAAVQEGRTPAAALGQMVREAPGRLHHTGRPIIEQMGQAALRAPKRAVLADASLAGLSGMGGELTSQKFGENSRVAGQISAAMTPLTLMAMGRGSIRGLTWAASNAPGGIGPMVKWLRTMGPSQAGARAERTAAERREFPVAPAIQRLGIGPTPSPEVKIAVRGGKFLEDAPLFATTKAGDLGIIALANSILSSSPKLTGHMKKNAQAVNRAINDAFSYLAQGSSVKATDKETAEASGALLTDLLDYDIRLQRAVTFQTLERIEPSGNLEQYSRVANNAVKNINDVVKAQIKNLYAPFPDTVKKKIGPLRQDISNLYDNLASTHRREVPKEIVDRFIPDPVSGKFKDPLPGMGPQGGGRVAIKELQAYRSGLLEIAKNAEAAGKARQAGITSQVAELVLRTMEASKGAVKGQAGVVVRRALDFTREAAMRLKLGETAQILAPESRQGGTRIAPIMTLDTAFGSGGIKAGQAFDDVQNTVDFQLRVLRSGEKLPGGSPITEQQMAENQRAFLAGTDDYVKQSFMEMAVDATTKRVKIDGANSFFTRWNPLLRRRPELKRQIEEAVAAEEVLLKMEDPSTSALRIFMPVDPSGRQIRRPPQEAIEELIASPNRDILMRKIVVALERDKSGKATEQFKRMWIDYFHFNSRAKFIAARPELEMGIVFSGEHIHNTLKMSDVRNLMRTPVRDGTPLFSQGDFRRLTKIANTARAIERQFATANTGDIERYTPKAWELTAGILGSQLGRSIATMLGGGTVQTPSITAGAFRDAIRHVSGVLDPTKELLLAAVFDEDLLRAVLTKNTASLMKKQEARTIINAWMYGVLMDHGYPVDILSSTEQEE
jgi:hypothetical protein